MIVGECAVVVAGGQARRWGGRDKLAVRLGEHTLLDWTLTGLCDARPIVCVGPERATTIDVHWCRERPAGGGPVAAVAAGLHELGPHHRQTQVWVVAGDQPMFGRAVASLRAALANRPDADVAVLTGDDGRRHHLAALWRVVALERAIGALPTSHGAAMRDVYASAEVIDVGDVHGAAADADSPDDLAALAAALGLGS